MTQIVKGIQSAKEIHDELISQDFTAVPMLIHFRIGTHGLKSDPKHTHPFPLGRNKEDMEKLSLMSKHAMIHNGIMSAFGYEKDISDSMAFARDVLPLLYPKINDEGVQAAISEILGYSNKIAILDGVTQMVWLFGKWNKGADGIFYSNDSYKGFGGADLREWRKPYYWGGCGTGTRKLDWEKEDDVEFPERTQTADDRDFSNLTGTSDPVIGANQKVHPRFSTGELWSELLADGWDETALDMDMLSADADKAIAGGDSIYGRKKKGTLQREKDALIVRTYLRKWIDDEAYTSYLIEGYIKNPAERKSPDAAAVDALIEGVTATAGTSEEAK
jgi:hypothetical protein